MKKYQAPTYTGLNTIQELIGMSKRTGNIWNPTGQQMDFNNDGYAFVPKSLRNQRSLIIDKSLTGTLDAYAWHYGHYRKLINFSDPTHAQDIINDLYSNPYYHGSSYYTDKIDRLVKGLDLTQFANIQEIKTHFEYLHERGCFYLEKIKQGVNTFGCAHRFSVISHRPYKLINLYIANFEGKAYKLKSKNKLVYEGSEWSGDYVYRYELEDIDYKSMFLKDGIFNGIELESHGVYAIIEAMMLEKIWEDILNAKDDVSNHIRVANQAVQYRGMFPNEEYLEDYVGQLNAVIHNPNALRDKFLVLFKKLYVDNGMVEKEELTVSGFFDDLPSL